VFVHIIVHDNFCYVLYCKLENVLILCYFFQISGFFVDVQRLLWNDDKICHVRDNDRKLEKRLCKANL